MARKKRKRNASRGSVNNIILKTLVNGDKYGYEIIKEVEEYSNGKIILKQPSLYSSLTRFEEKKFVTSYWGDSDIGGRRHYYHLTEEGLEYYKRVILKESDDDDFNEEDVQTVLDENNLTPSSSLYQNTEDEIFDEVEDNDNDNMVINEIDEDEIPEIVNFTEEIDDDNSKVIIPDHQFHSTTPLENMIDNKNLETQPNQETTSINSTENSTEQINEENIKSNKEDTQESYEQLIINLRDNTKQSNKKYIQNNPKKLYIRKPKKAKKIILDSDGIYKLRDEDYVPRKRQPEIIIDNVIKRSKPSSDVYGYASYTSIKNSDKPKQQNEMTDEEKRQKNENFVAKFNLLTMSKMKPVSAPVRKSEPVIEKKPEPQIDYRGKLNAIIESKNVFINDDDLEIATQSQPIENNMFNYIEDDKWNTTTSSQQLKQSQNNEEKVEKDEEDSLINLDEEETFETKSISNEYVDEINSYTAPPNQVKMTRYDNITQAVLVDKTYLLSNKLKMVFGIIMSLIMLVEVTVLLFVFRNLNLIQPTDKTLFIVCYVLIGIFALIYLLPYFMNSNNHKANNFKLKYSIWFGILTFLVCSILIYCFNALSGFEIDNFDYFAVKLIVPITLVFNFIIGPLIYSLLLKSKSFYD